MMIYIQAFPAASESPWKGRALDGHSTFEHRVDRHIPASAIDHGCREGLHVTEMRASRG